MGNLKVLHFSNDKQCNGVPLFLPRDRCGAPATLVELRPALGRTKMGLGPAACDKMDDEYANRCHVFQSTVRSLVEVHAETLEVLQLPGHVNDRMLSALRKCRRLWKLFAPLQPRLAEVCAAVPSVRQLSVRFGSCKASARHLAVLSQLPPTVEELTLVTYRRSPRLGREYKALGQACRALFALKRLSVVCILCKKTVDVPRIASCFEEGAGGGALDLKCVELKYVNLMR
ncbi:uncharacterized protein LOC117639320 [Thrips palmi]|uniref:Uncharacterized protein LOC117639320 n=1 Tax=Thrips palmi TaxID=161013 RepID=A0A6P8ZGV4_THRPL|nr:uncharacterized protein LOC117639320 [Thrips palmi]